LKDRLIKQTKVHLFQNTFKMLQERPQLIMERTMRPKEGNSRDFMEHDLNMQVLKANKAIQKAAELSVKLG
jgi:hypothetical protein